MTTRLEPRLSGRGVLSLHAPDDGAPLEDALAARLAAAFARSPGHLLLELAATSQALHPAWAWLRDLALRYIEAARLPEDERGAPDFGPFLAAPPPIVGADHLDEVALQALWDALDAAFQAALAHHAGSLEALLATLDPSWHAVGRVVFNLAENRKDPDFPFAFMATYTTRLSAAGKVQHLPLGRALEQYAGARQKTQLLALLTPVQRAARDCPWLAELVTSGEIYVPTRWTPSEVQQLLADVPRLEESGLVVRMPQGWGGTRPARPKVTATVGTRPAAGIGQEALLDFRVEVTLDGEALSDDELAALLSQSSGLAFLRGRWVELDAARLKKARERLAAIEARARAGGVSFNEALRLVARVAITEEALPDPDWSEVHAGPWLESVLAGLRDPRRLEAALTRDLRATLRPYQEVGVRWLDGLTRLGLGALLADDMGLGKTIQVIALLLLQRGRGPSLLVVPATLLGNWSQELQRFAPSLRVRIEHASATPTHDLADADLVITTYGMASRDPQPKWLGERRWHLVIADEAQAIRNPGTRAARALKGLQSHARVAMTGTPIENRVGDLWSLFDFLDPGLLGTASAFTAWSRRAATRDQPWARLRELLQPYILRRKKTDKRITPELPDKTEVDVFCVLSRRQAALYQEAVDHLAERLATSQGIARRGLVLATLMRLKQICNHPSQWLGDGDWKFADSGKLLRLTEIVDVIAARQEKALVFTQFREITEPLSAALASLFGAPGLVLTGETPVARRKELVRRFQEDEAVPFFVLSLKAGGTGLNLTAASHVVHFDRWWNPAVEDQASDRAFRIGQKKNVLVHKLVCRGTLEERIAAIIADKRTLARDVVEGGAEVHLTELGDAELLDLVRLDLRSALGEG